MKKSLLILSLITIIASCAIFRGSDAPPFKVKEFTSQKWFAGMAAGGMGTNYALMLKIYDEEADFKVDTVWIGARAFRAKLVDVKDEEGVKKLIMTKSRRPLNASEPESEWEWRETPAVSENPPDYDGTALIIYHHQKLRKKMVVTEKIDSQEPLNYP